jgi:hypothetical protein
MQLSELLEKYGSDKNASKYTETYVHFFEPIRNSVSSILEIGLGTIIPGAKSSMHHWRTSYVSDYKPGASLRAWQDYFPNAKVYGGDIQTDTQFTDERIKTFLFNSQNGVECNESLKELTFDIIIDDGDHDAISQIKTIYNLIGRVKPGGFYVIEDITPGNAEPVIQYINPLIHALELEPYLMNPEKNLLVLKFK